MTSKDRQTLQDIAINVAGMKKDIQHLCDWRDEVKEDQKWKRGVFGTSFIALLIGVFHFATGGMFK